LHLRKRLFLTKKKGVSGIFFGWWMVIASGVISFWGQSFCNFGFSAMFKPIATDLGFSRAATSVAASVAKLEGGFAAPVVGWITDRFGPRWIIFFGLFVVGLSLILMNFINSLWAFYAVWGLLLGIGTTMGLGLALDKTITNWFVKKRGRALSIKWFLFALATVLGLPMVGWLVSIQGWRITCLIAGLVMWVIGLPLTWFFFKQRRPEYYGLLPDGAIADTVSDVNQMIDKGVKYATENEEIEFTLRQAMRTPTYWLFLLSSVGFTVISPVLIIHGVPFVTDMGVDPLKATVLLGIMSSSAIPGTIIGGLVADRVKKQNLRFLLAGGYFLQIVGFVAFLTHPTLIMVYPLFVVHHFAGGIYGPLNSVIIARYFGRKAFGSIRGSLLMCMLPASIAAPIYAGWVYDTTGSYRTAFILCMVLVTLATIFISLAVPPKPPVHVTGIRQIV
jgi:sugar phosphate permease